MPKSEIRAVQPPGGELQQNVLGLNVGSGHNSLLMGMVQGRQNIQHKSQNFFQAEPGIRY